MQLFASILFFALLSQVIGHSYVTSPTSRSNQAQTNTGCRGPECLGPCDVPLARKTRAAITASRGSAITIKWPRNNHAGGFIRFAWAPTLLSDTHAAFDAHVQQINCHEVGGCYPDDPSQPNGGDSGPLDGSSRACSSNLTIPLDLVDGGWTLQWAWFGGAFGLGDYYSCVDYTISGGPVGLLTPKFVGGDYSYPGQQKCKFFNTNKLHVCVNEPCGSPIFPAYQQQSGAPASGELGIVSVTPTPVTPSSTTGQYVAPQPATTGRVAPVQPATTGRVVPAQPSTTGRVAQVQPSTTGRTAPVRPSTTGQVVVTPTPVPTVPVVPVESDNCAMASTLSASTAALTLIDSWGSHFRGVIDLKSQDLSLSDWIVAITWPVDISVSSAVNAGKFVCESESTRTAYFKPAAGWANNLHSGISVQIEFFGSKDLSVDADFILNNAVVAVYTQ